MSKEFEYIFNFLGREISYKRLDEVAEVKAGERITTAMMNDSFEYNVIGGGVVPTGKYSKYNKEKCITVSRAGSAGFVNWQENKFWATDVCFTISSNTERISNQFLYYYLKNNELDLKSHIYGGSMPKLDKKYLCGFKIPIVPEEYQEKVVSFLDRIVLLNKTLTNELEERKKELNYLKNILIEKQDYEKIPIGKLFTFKNGINKDKDSFGHGNKIINYVDVYKNLKLTDEMIEGLVDTSNNDLERYSCLQGDVFFTRTSETRDEVGMSSVLIEKIDDCVFSGFLLRGRPITDLLLPEYCAYCFSTDRVRNEIVNKSNFTTRATTTGLILSKISISVPSIDEQKKIVKMLDSIYSLVSDKKIGIPAEIELRRKQYEYYRNKLLSFEELSVSE